MVRPGKATEPGHSISHICPKCHLDTAVGPCRMLRRRMPCNPSLTVCRFCPNTNWHPPQGEIVLASYFCLNLEAYILGSCKTKSPVKMPCSNIFSQFSLGVLVLVTCHILQIPKQKHRVVHFPAPQENICHLGYLLLCRTLHHGIWHAFTDDNLGAALSTGGQKRQQGLVKLKSKRFWNNSLWLWRSMRTHKHTNDIDQWWSVSCWLRVVLITPSNPC